jgi:hypothetical protein
MFTITLSGIQAVRTGVEPFTTDRQSVMLAVTPTNRCSLYENRTRIARMKILCPEPLDEQTHLCGIEGRTRTDNLMLPGHVFCH